MVISFSRVLVTPLVSTHEPSSTPKAPHPLGDLGFRGCEGFRESSASRVKPRLISEV